MSTRVPLSCLALACLLPPTAVSQLIDTVPLPPDDDFSRLAEAFWFVHLDLLNAGPIDEISTLTFSWNGVDPATATVATAFGTPPHPVSDVEGFLFLSRSVIPEDFIGPEFLMSTGKKISYQGNLNSGPQSFGFKTVGLGPIQPDQEIYSFTFPDELGGAMPREFAAPETTGFDAMFYYQNSAGVRSYHDNPSVFKYFYAEAIGPSTLNFYNLLLVDDPSDGVDFNDAMFFFSSGEIIGGIPEPSAIGTLLWLAFVLAGLRRRR